MKITIIGSTGLLDRMWEHQKKLVAERHEVMMPYFDDSSKTAFGVCMGNYYQIKCADEVHLIWDGRSCGTILDFGMVMALGKPFRIIYIEPKTIESAMREYAGRFE